MPKSIKKPFKAGEEYEITMTVTVRVTPDEDCSADDLESAADEQLKEGLFDVDDYQYDTPDEDDDDED